MTAGTYTVSLTATNPSGSDTETKTSYITVNETSPEPPVANFVGSPTSGNVPLTVNFTDLSTGDITSRSWTFGDTGTSTAQNPSHTYSSAGTYPVSLTVTGPGGSDVETKTNYITVANPPPPASSMHVHSITVTTISASKGLRRGRAEVVIVDNFGDPVEGASVTGSFMEDIVEPGTANTNSSGVAVFLTSGTAKGRFHLTFCVDNVYRLGIGYNEVDNVETCDSNY
jgi:PKD repeat protein